MASTSQEQKFIGEARAVITTFIDAWTAVAAMRRRGDDLGLLSGTNVLTDSDFIGENAGLLAADFILALTTADGSVNQTDRRTITKVRY